MFQPPYILNSGIPHDLQLALSLGYPENLCLPEPATAHDEAAMLMPSHITPMALVYRICDTTLYIFSLSWSASTVGVLSIITFH